MKVNWFTKLSLKYWPRQFMGYAARQLGIQNIVFDKMHEAFDAVERVDIFPFSPHDDGHRGFMIVLDSKTALYFYQEGDHFSYDGFEMGEYAKGEVTVFDTLRNIKSPFP